MRTNDDAFGLTEDHLWLSRACRALGHPARVRIVQQLVHGQYVCGAIVEMLPLSQSTVSQHLKVLREAGLIQGEVEGPSVCYRLDSELLARLGHLVSGLAAGGSDRPGCCRDAWPCPHKW